MRFVPCDINEASEKQRTTSDIRKMLMKIVESGEACVEIKDFNHKNSTGCRNAIAARVKKDRFKQLIVTERKGRVFVINTLMAKDVD